MDAGRLFQLGTDLDLAFSTPVAAHAEEHTYTARHSTDESAPPPAANSDELRGNTEQDHFIRRNGKVFAGTHLIIEVIDGDGLDDANRIERAFRDCVTECGATLLHIHLHKFSPQGVSGVAVLAESHISVHTWPERRYGAFDVFMCGDAEPHRAVEVLRAAFDAGEVRVNELLRGDGIV